MNHQEIVAELKNELARRFDRVDLELDRHDTKLDLFLERVTRLEVKVENNTTKVWWLFGLVSATVVSLLSWVTKTMIT